MKKVIQSKVSDSVVELEVEENDWLTEDFLTTLEVTTDEDTWLTDSDSNLLLSSDAKFDDFCFTCILPTSFSNCKKKVFSD